MIFHKKWRSANLFKHNLYFFITGPHYKKLTFVMVLMLVLMLPCFFFTMYERAGLPFEKVMWNIARAKFL